MVDDLERERLALERERLRTERQKIAIELGLKRRPHHNLRATKDIWDKFGTFTTFTSSVVIGLAGVFATYAYNNRQLEIQHLEKDREQIRLENQKKISSKIELTKRLEAIFPYVSANDKQKRTFGFAMFVALGEQQLAIRLIGASGADEAADPVIQFAGPLWLRAYWKPDGKTINKENQDKLRDWMRRHDFSTEPGDITMFLYNDAPQYQAARVQAAKELSVGGRTATIRHVPEDQLDHVIGTLRAEGADVSRAKESDGDGWVVVGTFP